MAAAVQSFPPSRKPSPYANAPRLPFASESASLDPRSVVAGKWLELEIGPGRGGFLFERADAAPQASLIGLEIRRKWAAIVDERLIKRGYGARARVFAEDAKWALPRLGPDHIVRRVFLHFPDPWWKKRHQKRLVMGDVFLDQIARLLEHGGELYIQTDVEERAEQYESRILVDQRFQPGGESGGARLVENPFGARSPREHRAIADGLPVHRMLFRRV